MNARAKFLDYIQMAADVEKKSEARKHLGELGKLADEIEQAGIQVSSTYMYNVCGIYVYIINVCKIY